MTREETLQLELERQFQMFVGMISVVHPSLAGKSMDECENWLKNAMSKEGVRLGGFCTQRKNLIGELK